MVNKIAVIGAGLMGRWHCYFAKSCGASVAAVMDTDETRARALAERFGCEKTFAGIEALLAQTDAAVVHICTPTQTHAHLIKACLAAGKHVLVEKPLAGSVEETRGLFAAARKAGLLLNPVHQFPFQNGYMELMQRKASLGTAVRAAFNTCSAGGAGKSADSRREVLLEILPHPLSLFSGLLGESLSASAFRLVRFTDDDLELVADIDSTAVSIVISLRGRPTRNELSYTANYGSCYIDLFHGYSVFESGEVSTAAKMLKPLKLGAGLFVKAGTNLARRAVASEPAYPGLRELIRRFYHAVDTGGNAPISEHEIVLAAELIEQLRTGALTKV